LILKLKNINLRNCIKLISTFFYFLEAVKVLLNEIIESLKLLDYENKINVRIQLKDSLIKVAMLTKELDALKSK